MQPREDELQPTGDEMHHSEDEIQPKEDELQPAGDETHPIVRMRCSLLCDYMQPTLYAAQASSVIELELAPALLSNN